MLFLTKHVSLYRCGTGKPSKKEACIMKDVEFLQE
jgi:hypothetical protein